MATGNFKTMTDFPLIVAQDNGDGDSVDWAFADAVDQMEKAADGLDLTFFKVSVEGGYYTGAQFYVEPLYEGVLSWDDEDADCALGMSAEECRRRYLDEIARTRDFLNGKKGEIGLVELRVDARFSNGEVMYSRV